MRLFWARGYAAAGIEELTRAMGVPRSSLYQTFGDKQGLFLAAVEHYGRTRLAPMLATLEGGGTLAEDLAAFMAAVVRAATAEPATPGCLVSCALADCAGENERMRAELAARFDKAEAAIAARLERAQAEGALPADADCAALAAVLAAVSRGVMLRARSGAPAAALQRIADAALALAPRDARQGGVRRRRAARPRPPSSPACRGSSG